MMRVTIELSSSPFLYEIIFPITDLRVRTRPCRRRFTHWSRSATSHIDLMADPEKNFAVIMKNGVIYKHVTGQ